MNLLNKVCEKKDDSRMTANNLAIVMAPNLLMTKTDAPVFVASGNPLQVQTSKITVVHVIVYLMYVSWRKVVSDALTCTCYTPPKLIRIHLRGPNLKKNTGGACP